MRGMPALLLKDFQMLRRTPSIALLLVVYPAVVALLMGLAIGRPAAKPQIAIVNELSAGDRVVDLGGEKFDMNTLLTSLDGSVDAKPFAARAEALESVRAGDSIAAVVIPKDILDQLASGTAQGSIDVFYDASNAVRKNLVETTVKGVLVDTNRSLTKRFRDQTLDLLQMMVTGGKLTGGQTGQLMGIQEGQRMFPTLKRHLPPDKQRELSEWERTTQIMRIGIGYSGDLLNRVGEPIKIRSHAMGVSSSVPALAISVAALVSMMFVALLLGAGMLAYEQEDQMLSRLLRGLISEPGLVASKTLLAAICASTVGVLMLAGFAAFVDIRTARIYAWLPAIFAAAAGLAVAGVAIGAIVRDVRAASLVSFMVGLPLAAAALVPAESVGPALDAAIQGVSALFPFKPGLQLVQAGMTPGMSFIVPAIHLTVLSIAYFGVGVYGVRRARYR